MKLTKLGHVTFIIEMGGKRILTDPWLTDPIYDGRLEHREEIPMKPEDLDDIDLILATHAHEDHFAQETLEKLDKSIPIYCPAGECVEKAEEAGFETIHTMEPGNRVEIDDLTITATHARHYVTEIGFIIEAEGDGTLFFAGDTRRDERLFRLPEKFDIDVALLPIGGNIEPVQTREQLSPGEAAELAEMLKAKHIIPTEYEFAKPARFWGERRLITEKTVGEFEEAMKERKLKKSIVLLDPGDTWEG